MSTAPSHSFSTGAALSTAQSQVLDLISAGFTITDAATNLGVHRNTIAHWRHTSQLFSDAFQHAQYDRAIALHEEAVALAPKAFAVIEMILGDERASCSVLLRAAQAILKYASVALPEPPSRLIVPPPTHAAGPAQRAQFAQSAQRAQSAQSAQSENAAQFAQSASAAQSENDAQFAQSAQRAQSAQSENAAQSAQPTTYIRPTPKTGRNDACPCGSGLKFKKCCLSKPASSTTPRS